MSPCRSVDWMEQCERIERLCDIYIDKIKEGYTSDTQCISFFVHIKQVAMGVIKG